MGSPPLARHVMLRLRPRCTITAGIIRCQKEPVKIAVIVRLMSIAVKAKVSTDRIPSSQ